MLQGEHLGPSLALQPVVCLVSAAGARAGAGWAVGPRPLQRRRFAVACALRDAHALPRRRHPQVDATQFAGGAATPACLSHQLLADQVAVADMLVGSKADLCDEAAIRAFHAWAAELFPRKRLVATAQQGRLDAATAAALLAWPENGSGRGSIAEPAPPPAQGPAAIPAAPGGLPVQRARRGAASAPWLSSSQAESAAEEQPTPERPLRQQVQGTDGAHAACG